MAIDPNDWLIEFSKRLTPDDTVVCDSGSSYYLCHQRLRLPDGCRLITDLAQGAMGFAIPAAIGAALAKKKGHVYVITGDGSYVFMGHNIYTIADENITNITVYVLVNGGYKTILGSQRSWCGGREIGLQKDMVRLRDNKKKAPEETSCRKKPNSTAGRWLFLRALRCGDYEVRRPVVA